MLMALPIRGADLEVAPLFQEPLQLVVPRDHAQARKPSVRRRDLADQNVLTLERGHRLNREVQSLCDQCGARVLPEYEGTSLDTLRQMVGMGLGVTFLPVLYARLEVAGDRQVAVCGFGDKPLNRTVALAWRRSSPRRDQHVGLADLLRRVATGRVPELIHLRGRAAARFVTNLSAVRSNAD